MATRQLDRSEWKAYFDRVSKALGAKLVEIEVASLDIGDQVEGEWIPFMGITYDHKNDVVEVALEGVDHLVRRPQAVYVDEDAAEGLRSLEIVDGDGRKHLLTLKTPLALPAPEPA